MHTLWSTRIGAEIPLFVACSSSTMSFGLTGTLGLGLLLYQIRNTRIDVSHRLVFIGIAVFHHGRLILLDLQC